MSEINPSPVVITTKKELAAYLKEHDPEMLAFFQDAAKVFGPAEVVGYARAIKSNRIKNDNTRHQ